MNWQGFGRKRACPNRVSQITNNLSYDNQSFDLYSNSLPLERYRQAPLLNVCYICDAFLKQHCYTRLSSFLRWGETESTWYIGHCLAYCTNLGWWMMIIMMSEEQSVA
jgi:hypothetical protein